MCLAMPGKVLNISDSGALTRSGLVSFSGIVRSVNLVYVPEAIVGDFVIVHVGFAISKLDENQAKRIFDLLRELDSSENSDQGGGGDNAIR